MSEAARLRLPVDSSAPLAHRLASGRTLVMGVLNVTPDSFSDGGQFLDPTTALARARGMIAEGADIIDIGGESSRPYGGAQPVPLDEENARVMAVLPAVVGLDVLVSIDTMKAAVADRALAAGAHIVNDVWGLQRDPLMAKVVADHGAAIVITHNREAADPTIDIVDDICAFFARSLDIAERAAVAREGIILDPGIGFGKTPAQSMTAIARLDSFKVFGLPLLIGASRKRFIDSVVRSDPANRLGGSIASHLLAAAAGAAIVRAHDVGETVQALRVDAAIRGAR